MRLCRHLQVVIVRMWSPTAVLLLVVSVALCHALSKDEIEDFTDYLWKTSVLDQNLKGELQILYFYIV